MTKQDSLFKILTKSPYFRIEIQHLIPPTKKIYKDYSKFSEKQRSIFQLLVPAKQEKPYVLKIIIRPEKLLKKITDQEFQKGFRCFSKAITREVDTRILVFLHRPIDKYETQPTLPLKLDEKVGKLGEPVLSGVRLTFPKTKNNFRMVTIDVSPCMYCGKVDISICLHFQGKMMISEENIVCVLEKAREYSRYFYTQKFERKRKRGTVAR